MLAILLLLLFLTKRVGVQRIGQRFAGCVFVRNLAGKRAVVAQFLIHLGKPFDVVVDVAKVVLDIP